MPTNNKLLSARATRVEEEIADALALISDHDGLKPAEVDRQILTWFTLNVAVRRRPGTALKQFLRRLKVDVVEAIDGGDGDSGEDGESHRGLFGQMVPA